MTFRNDYLQRVAVSALGALFLTVILAGSATSILPVA